MTLNDVLSVTCCAVKIIHHCSRYKEIFISRDIMQGSNECIYSSKKGLIQFANYEVLAMNTYFNNVETVLTIII